MPRPGPKRSSSWVPDQGPELLREIVGRLVSARGWGRRQGQLKYERAWEEVAGVKLATHSKMHGFRRGVFEVLVDSAVAQHELNFHKRKLLEQLRKQLPGTSIHDLRFRAGTWTRNDESDDQE
ncbi:MAG: DUF721 domain-containing protein [Gemmataceae bacterium]